MRVPISLKPLHSTKPPTMSPIPSSSSTQTRKGSSEASLRAPGNRTNTFPINKMKRVTPLYIPFEMKSSKYSKFYRSRRARRSWTMNNVVQSSERVTIYISEMTVIRWRVGTIWARLMPVSIGTAQSSPIRSLLEVKNTLSEIIKFGLLFYDFLQLWLLV